MIIDQVNRDNSIGSLLAKMNEVYTFLTEKELRDIESMKLVVEHITLQTLDCSDFIQEYSKNEKFRKLRSYLKTTGGELTCLSRDEVS
jgi:hypothetical protein